ncbi:MAG TPA: response regulator [Burkholderiaceae bacterium]|nr:response regulator [Burkholderiaceae bacterium]
MAARTVFIVDDNNEFRLSAQWLLAGAGYQVVDFADPGVALQALHERPPFGPACMLLDVRMPGMSGLDLHDRLNRQGVQLPTIYMTGHGDIPLAVEAMKQGAVTFLEKPFPEDALEQALEQAFNPARPLPRPASHHDDAAAREWAERFGRLTPREREVLDLVLKEKLNKTIADLLHISIKTVELHRANLMRKLGADSVIHLVRMAVSERAA